VQSRFDQFPWIHRPSPGLFKTKHATHEVGQKIKNVGQKLKDSTE